MPHKSYAHNYQHQGSNGEQVAWLTSPQCSPFLGMPVGVWPATTPVVVGLSASGDTPYVIGAVRYARSAGATIVGT